MFTQDKNSDLNLYNEDNLDLGQILKTLWSKKYSIFFATSLSSIITVIFLVTSKPIWQGRFNIVISDSTEKNSTGFENLLGSTFNFKTSDNSTTQKLILKSSSVLTPVFDFVKKYYSEKGVDKEGLEFRDWVSSELDIDYKDGSKVLYVKHKNKDKELILEVLSRISKEYQAYSKKQVKEKIIKSIEYLTDQNQLMQKATISAQSKFNKFSIENGLGNIDGFVGLGKNNTPNQITSLGSQSFSRLENKIIENNIPKPENLFDAGQRFQNQFSLLENYESEYMDLKSKLKPNSKLLKSLKNNIENLRNSLKRPNEILVEYKNLQNLALRNENILENIQTRLEIKKLELIETPDPWTLISEPRLDKTTIFPKKKFGLIVSTLFSFFIISGLTLFKSRYFEPIYFKDELDKEINADYLETLNKGDKNLSFLILDKIILKENNKKIGFVNYKNELNVDLFGQILNAYKNVQTANLKEDKLLNNFDSIILVIEKGEIKFNEIVLLNKYLNIYNHKIKGWIFID